MGFRFHKSRSIIPGLRVNLSKSGPSVSLGPQGAHVNIGPKGVRTTIGVPGTGLSHITQKSWGAPADPQDAETAPVLEGLSEDEKRAVFLRMLAARGIQEGRGTRWR